MSRAAAIVLGLALATVALPARAGCGAEPASCRMADGNYEIALPDTPRPDRAAVMFIHGFGGSGPNAMKRKAMIETVLSRGYAVIAPTGMPRPGRDGFTWSFRPDAPGPRDDIAFLKAVRDDAARRFGIDAGRVLLAGFSIGGSMTAYLACAEPGAFAAYAPVGGNFWRPHPEACAGPVRMLHTHGWTDETVPLEGRILRGETARDPGAVVQGDVFEAMQIWRETNGCTAQKPDRFIIEGPFWRRIWDRCTKGSSLELALFPGGHVVPEGWATMALGWFETQQD